MACSRVHRDNHPPDAPADEKEKKPTAAPTAAGAPPPSLPTKPAHPFHVLDDAPELRRLFAQYPTLPARLRSIYEATQPPKAGGGPDGWSGGSDPRMPWRTPYQSSRGGGSGGRGDRGGGRGGRGGGRGGSSSSKPWTQEMGLRQGQKALRRARVDPGEDGDGVRAYCETVTYLLAREEKGEGGGHNTVIPTNTNSDSNDLTAVVREELAAEANQLIKQLLDAEGRQ